MPHRMSKFVNVFVAHFSEKTGKLCGYHIKQRSSGRHPREES